VSNKLNNWIKARSANHNEVLNVLQEYGVISDNCVNVEDVGNDMEAMKWMACNHNLIKNDNSKPLD
jgi:hypothetical protein